MKRSCCYKTEFLKFLLLLIVCSISKLTFAQQKIDTATQIIDSVRLTKFNSDSVKKYFKASDTLIAYQLRKVEEYSALLNSINAKLRRGFDTSYISNRLPESDSAISIAKANLTGLRGRASLKILSTTKLLLEQQQERLSKWQGELSQYNNELNVFKDQLGLIRRDSNLLIMPSDSMLFIEYIKKLKPLGQKITDADSAILLRLKQLGILQNNVSTDYLAASNYLDEANFQIHNFSSRLLENEFGYIWDQEKNASYNSDFRTVVVKSMQESKTLLSFYSGSNWLSRVVILLFSLGFYFLMRRNILRIKKQSDAPKLVLAKTNHVGRHLFTSTVVFSLMLIPFVYGAAPQAFTQSLWALQIIGLAFLIRNKLSITQGVQIFLLLLLFYMTGFTNLLVETTLTERWIQVVISMSSIALGCWLFIAKEKSHFNKTSFYKPLVAVFILINVAALLLNVTGRVTLAKVLNTGANYGIIQAINLLVLVEIIIDAVFLSMEASKNSSRITAYFEFKGMDKRLRTVLGFLAGLLWLVIFTKNMHIYEAIFGNITEFLSIERTLGNMSFTFGSIAIFILVIWVSTLLSQMVAFIFGNHDTSTTGPSENKVGSTVLLLRLGILSAGLLLAFAASGIPLDKLAIVIGALGVGIGFGLQNIVNNLVSGVVLAFEKPLRIGDTIEVGTRMGVVNEIGIRSSKLTTYDGSEVIIPNGDLLSQHLINWTKNNDHRRAVLPIGVAYGSDINKVKEIIKQVLIANEDVFKFPEAIISLQNFGSNSVDFKVYFWTEVEKWFELKSEIFAGIYDALNKEGIGIPFPQRDLHIKSIDKEFMSEFLNVNENLKSQMPQPPANKSDV